MSERSQSSPGAFETVAATFFGAVTGFILGGAASIGLFVAVPFEMPSALALVAILGGLVLGAVAGFVLARPGSLADQLAQGRALASAARSRPLVAAAVAAALALPVLAVLFFPGLVSLVLGAVQAVEGLLAAGVVAIVGICLILFGVLAVLASLRSLWVGLKLRLATPDAVGDAVEGGAVNLEGTARPHEETLRSPFLGRDCLGFTYEIKNADPREKNDSWDTQYTGGTSIPFLLETDDGVVLVDPGEPDEVDLSISDDTETVDVPIDSTPPEEVREFIEETDSVYPADATIEVAGVELGKDVDRRYVEHVHLPGEETYVSGVARDPGEADDWGGTPEVDAVVVPPDGGGLRELLARLTSLSFQVGDASMNETGSRYLWRAIGLFVFGLFMGGGGIAALTLGPA